MKKNITIAFLALSIYSYGNSNFYAVIPQDDSLFSNEYEIRDPNLTPPTPNPSPIMVPGAYSMVATTYSDGYALSEDGLNMYNPNNATIIGSGLINGSQIIDLLAGEVRLIALTQDKKLYSIEEGQTLNDSNWVLMANDVVDFYGDYYNNYFVETSSGYYRFEQWGANSLTKINTTKNIEPIKKLAEDVLILKDVNTNDFYFIQNASDFNKIANNTPDYNGISNIQIGDYSELTFKNNSGQFEYYNLSQGENGVFNFSDPSNIEITYRQNDYSTMFIVKTKDNKLYASSNNNFDYVEIANDIKTVYMNNATQWRRGSDDKYFSGSGFVFVKNDKTQYRYFHSTQSVHPLTVHDNGQERVVGEIVENVYGHGHYSYFRTTNELYTGIGFEEYPLITP